MEYEVSSDEHGNPYLKVAVSDYALISNPLLNKGMAFTHKEREEFNLLGLIPPYESTLEIQRDRSYEAYKSKPSDIEKYIYLRDLQDSNEVLFYNLVSTHITEMMPIVYTPTVGLGCERYSHIYRRSRGLFISYPDKNYINNILSNPRFNNVKVIVVSDGERILGLGDQGAGGMGIPIGKLALYTACAGIHPGSTLPILLDTGTNNPDLLKDPLYIGWHHERIRGDEYNAFIDTFVKAVKKRFPHVLLQWEDFAQQNANPLLERYRNELCSFNDDIQGTAAVAAGTLFAAMKVTNIPLTKQRIAVVGAGSAGCGISSLLLQAMIDEGLSEKEARACFYLIDRPGLLLDDMNDLFAFQKPFAQSRNTIAHWKLENQNAITLKDVINNLHPTVLIGVSGQPGIFTEELIRDMAKHVAQPVIFPLSNPTTRAEATPADLLKWTNHKAIIGTGSPFPGVTQTNNSYIFPGMGLGIMAVKAKHISDKMFMAAAKALAASPTTNHLLPPLSEIREVSFKVAVAVAEQAIAENLAEAPKNNSLEVYIRSLMWKPEYLPYRKK